MKKEMLTVEELEACSKSFNALYVVNPETGCWEWEGELDGNARPVFDLEEGNEKTGIEARLFPFLESQGGVSEEIELVCSCNNPN